MAEVDRFDFSTVTASVSDWLPPVPSNIGCETVATLLTLLAALAPTATVIVSVGRSAPTATLAELWLQVTTWPTAAQDQPVPVPDT